MSCHGYITWYYYYYSLYTKKIIYVSQKVFPLPEVSVKAIVLFWGYLFNKVIQEDTQRKLEPFHHKPYVM